MLMSICEGERPRERRAVAPLVERNRSAIAMAGLGLLVACLSFASDAMSAASAQAWRSDQGNGTYRNPPLNADYPDPDIIRVGSDFYLATTTFANSPGLRILHSRDLVNWEIVGHVIPRLLGREQYDLRNGNAYRSGVFAPSLRFHAGTFYVAVTPVGQNTRIYSAKDPKGPWHVVELDRPAFDPALFFDTDDKGYIATSGGWDGTETLLTLDPSYSRVTDSRKIHFNKGAEGSKLVKRGHYYYLFNAIPARLALTVSRSMNLAGPWETRDQIDDRSGGHQGAIVDLPDGSYYGFAMRDLNPVGRITNISPIFWKDDWPVWGTLAAPNQVPTLASKPIRDGKIVEPATSDEFALPTLGRQWEWNHNPDNARWSLSQRPGFLRLHAGPATSFWDARNTLVQKGQAPVSRGEIRISTSGMKAGDRCGLGTLGKFNGNLQIVAHRDGRKALEAVVDEDTTTGLRRIAQSAPLAMDGSVAFLRLDMNFDSANGTFAFSRDGARWRNVGAPFTLAYDWRTGTFQGPQFAISCYNIGNGPSGFIDVDWFHLSKP